MSRVRSEIEKMIAYKEIEKANIAKNRAVTVRIGDFVHEMLSECAIELGTSKADLSRLILEEGVEDVMEALGKDPKKALADYQAELLRKHMPKEAE